MTIIHVTKIKSSLKISYGNYLKWQSRGDLPELGPLDGPWMWRQPTCEDGHGQPLPQKFCGECGGPVAGSEELGDLDFYWAHLRSEESYARVLPEFVEDLEGVGEFILHWAGGSLTGLRIEGKKAYEYAVDCILHGVGNRLKIALDSPLAHPRLAQ